MVFLRIASVLALFTSLVSAGTIRLKTRELETGREVSLPGERPVRRLNLRSRHLMLEFDAPLDTGRLAELEARGAVVTSALGMHSVMASVPEDTPLDRLGIRWSGYLNGADKTSPLVRQAAASAVVVVFHQDVSWGDGLRILRGEGLTILRDRGLPPGQFVVATQDAYLAKLAEWDEVAYIFPASNDLISGAQVHACIDGALIQGLAVAQYVTVSSGWPANTPNGVNLGYVFTTLTPKVADSQVRSEVIRAMRSWSQIARVTFAEGSNSAATSTVAIEFGTAVNGDPTPFDLAGTILAHTYYPAPPNPEPIAGDLHFNPAENWHVGANVDIYTVALHELGHALGLGHTDNPADVMYPYYRFGSALSANDIAGVVSLYGAPADSGGSGSSTPPPTLPLSLVIGTPVSGLHTNEAALTLNGSLQNASGSAIVSWQASGGRSGTATGNPNWTASGIPLIPGMNLITVTATDGPGRTASRVVNVLRSGGTGSTSAGPVISILSPRNPVTTAFDSVTITGTASSPAGISRVTWQTNGGASGTALGTVSWTASGVPLLPGPNVVLLRVFDLNGVMRPASLNITRN